MHHLIRWAINYDPEMWIECFVEAGLHYEEASRLKAIIFADPQLSNNLRIAGF